MSKVVHKMHLFGDRNLHRLVACHRAKINQRKPKLTLIYWEFLHQQKRLALADVGPPESSFEDININSWFNLANIVIKIVICSPKHEGNAYGGIISSWLCLYGNAFKGVVQKMHWFTSKCRLMSLTNLH